MLNRKTLLATAALALLTTAGIGAASAQPWNRFEDRMDRRIEHRMDRHDYRMERRFERRAFVNSWRIRDALRFHHYRVIGEPFFMRGAYVVRTHDRFGRVALIQVDPYTGTFIRRL